MPVLTSAQRARIDELIDLHHSAFLVEILGPRAVPKEMLDKIKRAGLYKPRKSVIDIAYQLGQQGVLNAKTLKMSRAEFKQHLTENNVQLDDNSRTAVDILRRSVADHFRALSAFFKAKVNQAVTKADKDAQRRNAQRQRPDVFSEIERRKALASIARDLATASADQINQAGRVIYTETNNAYQEGRAAEIMEKAARAGDYDPDVFKRPRPDACEECKEAYLEDDRVTPIVFKMSALVANGSNIGRPKGSRKPVLDSMHPHCACELQWKPAGFSFNEDGQLVYVGTEKRA